MESLTFDQLPIAVSQLTKKLEHIERLLLDREQQPPEQPQEQYFLAPEAATFLGVVLPTLYSKVSRGELPYMKRGKRLHFSRTELMDYLKGGRRLTNAEIEALFLEMNNYQTDHNSYVLVAEMYADYRTWTKENGFFPVTSLRFVKRMRVAKVTIKKSNKGNVAYLIKSTVP